MRTAPLGVLFLSVAVLWAGCTVESHSDDDDAGESGEGGSSGSGGKSSGKAGTAGKAGSGTGGYADGGTAGTAGTGEGKAGSSNAGNGGYGGDVFGGGSGEGGWDTGTGGTPSGGTYGESGDGPGPSVGGEGGWPSKNAGAGGEGDVDPVVCDADDPQSSPYPDCEPVDADNSCEVCVQQSCCEESEACWAFGPKNACGWGGPNDEGEITCYQTCVTDWLDEHDGQCGQAALDECADRCATTACGEIADATWSLFQCMNTSCYDECFGGSCTIPPG